MPVGATNPMPFRCGGGPTGTERAFEFTRQAVGKGGSSPDPLSIESLWRRSKAKAFSAIASNGRRAVLQAWPFLATDGLPYYERVLALVAGPDDSETDRRDAASARWGAQLGADIPALRADLKAIDSRLDVFDVPNDKEITTQHGRAFAPLDVGGEAPSFGGNPLSVLPNYSTSFVIRVQFLPGYEGPLTGADLRVVERVRALLLDVIASWCDFWIFVGTAFFTGTSPAGLAGPS